MAKVNEDQMTTLSSMVGDIYSNMSQELFMRMIRRIKQRGTADLQDNPYLWQLEKLNDMHMLNDANIDLVIKQTGVAKELIYKIIENEGLKVYKDTAEQLKEDLNRPSFKYNGVQDSLSSLAKQTFLDIDNLINQTLLTTSLGDNAAMRAYKGMLEQAVAEVVAGTKTADKAISDTVMKWLDKGIDSNFIDKGGHVWSIDRYARTVMQSTTYRVYNDMRTKAADEFGIDTFHMSTHAAARPACAPIQGHIVTKSDKGFMSDDPKVGRVYSLLDYGYGHAGGTMGINCHHVLTPFVIGVNELPDDNIPNPKDAIANGEKQAKQRSYERGIREAKYKLEVAKNLGDLELINKYKNLLNSRCSGLRQLLENNSFLYRDYSREKIYQNRQLKDSIDKLLKNKMNSAESEYSRIIKKFGNNGLPTKREYKKLVYNSSRGSRLLKQYIKDRDQLQIEPLTDFNLYSEIDNELYSKVDGLKTIDGHTVKSHSLHAISRIIGVREKGGNPKIRRVGISVDDIVYTLKHGKVSLSKKNKEVNVYESYRGKVTVDIVSGNLIQGSSKGA